MCLCVCVRARLHVLCTLTPGLVYQLTAKQPEIALFLSTTELFSLTRKSVRRPGRTFSLLMATGDEQVCSPLSRECIWNQLDNTLVRSQCAELLREEKLSLHSSGKANAITSQAQWESGDNEVFSNSGHCHKDKLGKRLR